MGTGSFFRQEKGAYPHFIKHSPIPLTFEFPL